MLQEYIQQADDLDHPFSSREFDPEYWLDQSGTSDLHGGRGGSLKFILLQQPMVLHRYLRGGLVARFMHDQYLWMGFRQTRPFKEQLVVEHARAMDLPVPRMLAYRIQKRGVFYRAASINQFIENQGSLADYLGQQPLLGGSWEQLGKLIKNMHQAGIYHADLNANNILIDHAMGFHLIDFDKARLNPAGTNWRLDNLQRLRRSLDKIAGHHAEKARPFNFVEADWQAMLGAYGVESGK